MIEVSLSTSPIDPVALRQALPALPNCGGLAAFEGHIRDHNHGRPVGCLEYEAYPELAVKEMRAIANEAVRDYGLSFLLTVHRVGRLEIGEPAVVIHALAPHRAEAFAGCRYMIDQLKSRVPIWKKEFYSDGSAAWTRCHHV